MLSIFDLKRTWIVLAAFCGLIAAGTGILEAQVPQTTLTAVFPPGGQQGQTVEVTVVGSDLDDVDRMIFSHPGITATQKTQESAGQQVPVANTFLVTIPNNVAPGYYESRVVGYFGVSNPRTFVVDDRLEIAETEPNNEVEKAQAIDLGTIVNARSNGTADVDFFKFHAAANRRLVISAEAQRIDSRMQTQLELLGPDGRRIERSRNGYRDDPILDFTPKADGDFYLRVTDFTYRGGNDFFYRLHVNTGPHIDFVMPPSGLPGSTGRYTLFGRNLPGGAPSGIEINGAELQKLDILIALPSRDSVLALDENVTPEESVVDGFAYRLNSPEGTSNAVYIHFADAPVSLEHEPNDAPEQAQRLTIPAEVGGQFQKRLDSDRYTFEAKAGEVYYIEVYGQRLGKQTDPRFVLEQITKNDKGEEQVKRLTDQDDVTSTIGGEDFNTRNRDPVWRFQVPADSVYRLTLSDRYRESRGGPQLVYRLVIRKQSPDFRLVTFASIPNPQRNQSGSPGVIALQKGHSVAIDVFAHRIDGFDGNIRVTVEGLPAGVSCPGAVIGSRDTSARLIFTAAENADVSVATIKVVGTATVDDPAAVAALAQAVAAVKPARDALPKLQKSVGDAQQQVTAATEALKAPTEALKKAQEVQTAAANDLKAKIDADAKAKADQKNAATALTKAGEIKTKADAAAKAAAEGLKNAQEAKAKSDADVAAAEKSVEQAEADLKAKQEALAKAKEQLQKDPENQAKKDAVAQAEKQVADATAAQTKATDALAAAKKVQTTAANDLKAKTDAVAAAKAAQKTADTELAKAKQAKTAADNAAKTAATQLKAAQDAKTKADQGVAAADANLKKSQADLKAKTDALAKAKADLAAGEKRVADARAAVVAAEKAKHQAERHLSRNSRTASLLWQADPNAGQESMARMTRSLTLSVMDATSPFHADIVQSPAVVEVNQSRQILLPVKVERREGFDKDVNLTFTGFDNKSKLQVENKPLKKGETEGVRRIFVPKDAPPGAWTVYLNSQAQASVSRNPVAIAKAKAKQDAAENARKAAEEANKQATTAQQKADAGLKAADAKFKTFEKTFADADKAMKDAQAAVTKADQAAKAAAEAAKKAAEDLKAKTVADAKAKADQKAAATGLTAATQAKTKADDALKQQQVALAKAKEELQKDPENQAKKDAVAQAEKAVADATAAQKAADEELKKADAAKKKADEVAQAAADQLKASQDAKAKADTGAKAAADALAKAQADLKAKTEAVAKATAGRKAAEAELAKAKEVKAKADAELKTAADQLKAAQAAKTNADKNFNNVNNANKAKNVNLTIPSSPVLIVIKPAPVELSANVPNGGNLKKGTPLEVKVSVKRQNGFDGPVNVQLPLPPGVAGITSEPLTIPAGQTEGILKISAAGDATEGKIANMVIEAVMDFDGEAAVDAPITLNVTK